jgi:hypothetical protein
MCFLLLLGHSSKPVNGHVVIFCVKVVTPDLKEPFLDFPVSNFICFLFPEGLPKQLNKDKIIEILDQAKASEWCEVMINANIRT